MSCSLIPQLIWSRKNDKARIMRCTFGGGYEACVYLHARWSYHRQLRSLLLCPLSDECYSFPNSSVMFQLLKELLKNNS